MIAHICCLPKFTLISYIYWKVNTYLAIKSNIIFYLIQICQIIKCYIRKVDLILAIFRQQKEISKHNFEPCRSKYAKCQIERGDPVSQLFESETYEFDMYVNCIMWRIKCEELNLNLPQIPLKRSLFLCSPGK